MNIRKRWKAFRSAVTGRWVKREYAEEHPETTTEETLGRE